MPAEAGVYAIKNINSGRQYIGSSINLKERMRSHIRKLYNGNHDNHLLQKDFFDFSADSFEVKIIEKLASSSNLNKVEADQIKSLLNSGYSLYNMTEDGQGISRGFYSYKEAETVSDRLAKQHAVMEQQRINTICSQKRQSIMDAFDLQVKKLIPKPNFLLYFMGVFFGVLFLFVLIFPNMDSGLYLTLSVIAALVVTAYINVYLKEKAMQSAEYLKLLKQRDDQLHELDNEHKNML